MEREAGEQKIHNEIAKLREVGEGINLAASLSHCEIIAARETAFVPFACPSRPLR